MKVKLESRSDITHPKYTVLCHPVSLATNFTCLATAFAKSLQVSVLPVPAGPSGAPPRFRRSAPIKVLKNNKKIVRVN